MSKGKINVLEFINEWASENYAGYRNEDTGKSREPYEGELAYGSGLFHTIKILKDYRRSFGSRVQPFRKV